MYIRFSLVTICLALGTLSSPVKRDVVVATISGDIGNIDTQTKALDTAVTAFPDSSGTITQALDIHEAALSLDNAVKGATGDANASTPLSETAGNAVLALAEVLVPDIQQTLTDLVSKKAALTSLSTDGVSSLVLSDLETLKRDSNAFITALLAVTPADLVGSTEAQATLVENAFNNAIATYSS